MDYICSVCQRKIQGELILFKEHTDQHIIDLLKNDHPEWVTTDGVCPQCAEYYRAEIKGSIFKDVPCVQRNRKIKGVVARIKSLFQRK